MDVFNDKVFFLGGLFLLVMVLSNALFSLFCVKFKIKISVFSIFTSKIKKVHIRGVDYVLGWLPIASYVQPFGIDPDAFRHRELSETELSQAFFTKEDYKKAFILFSPSIIYLIFGIAFPLLYLITQHDYSMHQHWMYITEFFNTITGDDLQITNFGRLTKEIVSDNSIVLFTFLMFSSGMFFLSLLNNYGSYLQMKHENAKGLSTVVKIVTSLVSVALTILIWVTLLRYFDFSEIIVYILNIVLGMYASGIVAYLMLLVFLKALNKNKE